jgi:hypothetical protein
MTRKVIEEHDGWYAIVDGQFFGAWRSRVEALAGYEVELRRAARRKCEHDLEHISSLGLQIYQQCKKCGFRP